MGYHCIREYAEYLKCNIKQLKVLEAKPLTGCRTGQFSWQNGRATSKQIQCNPISWYPSLSLNNLSKSTNSLAIRLQRKGISWSTLAFTFRIMVNSCIKQTPSLAQSHMLQFLIILVSSFKEGTFSALQFCSTQHIHFFYFSMLSLEHRHRYFVSRERQVCPQMSLEYFQLSLWLFCYLLDIPTRADLPLCIANEVQ